MTSEYGKRGAIDFPSSCVELDVRQRTIVSLPEDTEESEDTEDTFIPSKSHRITGTGDVNNALSHIPDIGKFVAEIVDDERTMNRYVFCYSDEKTQNELWEIARRAKANAGGGALKATPKHESEEQVLAKIRRSADGSMAQIGSEYILSMFIRGDNTVESAKKPEYGGALDARELYPHIKVSTAEDVAKELYKQ